MTPTLYFHDYETFGADPARDRPVQFAGIRTDLEFNEIGAADMFYCRPATDVLPHPIACLVTGIDPARAQEQGVNEAEFFRRIAQVMSVPGTCTLGYNNLRFDDEVTRYGLYRNFFDPYAREWQNGNSRWDLLDLVRATAALRPEGINWPKREDGFTSFKLEHLTVANGIDHGQAHDALADVRATIAIARLIKTRHPKLYDYFFQNRGKAAVSRWVNPLCPKPVLHISGMFPAERGHAALVLPLAALPGNKNGVVAIDLSVDPSALIEENADTLRERLYTRSSDLPAGIERPPLKTIHINKCPIVAPLSLLSKDPATAARLKIDLGLCEQHYERLISTPDLVEKIQEIHSTSAFSPNSDPDLQLYSGGFFSPQDKALIQRIPLLAPDALKDALFPFKDPRLDTMLLRYRARNWPETLDAEEQALWQSHRRSRLIDGAEGHLSLAGFHQALNEARDQASPQQLSLLLALEQFVHSQTADLEG